MAETKTLYDIPELRRLEPIGKQFDVRFTVIGSIPRRVLLSQTSMRYAAQSLFDLCPYTSDIDLVHSGAPELTPEIVRTIFYRIPFAEAFRWQVSAASDRAVYDSFLKQNSHIVPDNLLELDQDGLRDPAQAARDYQRQHVRFIYNERYDSSALPHGDLPLFAALMSLRNTLEAMPWFENLNPWDAQTLDGIRRAVLDSITDESITRLRSNPYLRRRLVYLLAAFTSAAPNPTFLDDIAGASSISTALRAYADVNEDFGRELSILYETQRNNQTRLLSSAMQQGLRLPLQLEWETDSFPMQFVEQYFGKEATAGETDIPLLASRPIPISEGKASCSGLISDEIHEMVHLEIPLNDYVAQVIATFSERGLSAAVGICAYHEGVPRHVPGMIFALPTVCNYREKTRTHRGSLQIRLNCYGILEKASELLKSLGSFDEGTAIRVFILGLNEPGDEDYYRPRLRQLVASFDDTFRATKLERDIWSNVETVRAPAVITVKS